MSFMSDNDFYSCKHFDGCNDDGEALCGLCGLTCGDVLRYGDEGCKFEEDAPHNNNFSLFGDD